MAESRTVIQRSLVAGLLAAALPSFLAAPLPAAAQSMDPTASVDSIFQAWDSEETPGCAVGVSRDGEPVLERSYGMADLEHGIPSTSETIYEAGSVSKQFTAAAVILLALDGELALDDDVRDYVPELPDYGHTITLRHLLNHTSGLRDWGSVAALSGWGRGSRTHTHEHVVEIISRQSALNYPPGDLYSYTNSGYNLLAIIVERVSGTSFADFSRERIFEPLGLESTEWRDDYRRLVPGRATAYSPAGEGFRINQPIEDVHGNGGLLTTVGDLLVWTESLEAATLAGPNFVELMQETAVLNDGRPITYASGIRVDDYRGLERVSHTGSTAGYRAYLARYPEERLAVAMLCNVSAVSTGGTGGAISDVFLPDLPEEAPVTVTVELDSVELQSVIGLYRNQTTGEPLRLVLEEEQLRIDGGPDLHALGPDRFQLGSGATRLELEPQADASRPLLRRSEDGWHDATYEPVEPAEPNLDILVQYAGDYHSPDARATLTATVEDGTLVLHRSPGDRFPLEPVYRDAFESSLGLVRFHRDGNGRVRELSLRQARIHDIRFRRGER